MNFLEAFVENLTDSPGKKSNERHGQKGNQGQGAVYVEHEADCSSSQDNGVGEGHQTHTGGQLYSLDVVGGMSHEVAGTRPVEIGKRESLQVGKETITQSLLDVSRMAKEATSPDEAKGNDAQSQPQNHPSIR